MIISNIRLPLESADWGEASLNTMVRAFGLKKGPRAKCKSCLFHQKYKDFYTCAKQFPVEHDGELIACVKYNNKMGSAQ